MEEKKLNSIYPYPVDGQPVSLAPFAQAVEASPPLVPETAVQLLNSIESFLIGINVTGCCCAVTFTYNVFAPTDMLPVKPFPGPQILPVFTAVCPWSKNNCQERVYEIFLHQSHLKTRHPFLRIKANQKCTCCGPCNIVKVFHVSQEGIETYLGSAKGLYKCGGISSTIEIDNQPKYLVETGDCDPARGCRCHCTCCPSLNFMVKKLPEKSTVAMFSKVWECCPERYFVPEHFNGTFPAKADWKEKAVLLGHMIFLMVTVLIDQCTK